MAISIHLSLTGEDQLQKHVKKAGLRWKHNRMRHLLEMHRLAVVKMKHRLS